MFSAETLRHLEGLRIESQAEHVTHKTLRDQLEKLDPKELTATIPTIRLQDNQLSEHLQALAIVEQRLVSLKTEFGPEAAEVRKAEAQRVDLREKIAMRTSGILKGLQAKVASTGEGLASLSNAVVNAQESD